ncbi:carboxypeptidase-like regulatory domain-containing protein, partial [Flavobacterium sp.]|uniref:carboxypeptidase-like regulatory domain-containing protein n=1 Tax=Flavobacterium sp. TaxID=239 RepID=UPI002612CA75
NTLEIMKTKILLVFFVFLFQIGYSQTEEMPHGKTLINQSPLEGIEVINLMTKKSTTTDSKGHFAILAKPKDVLVFISKNYEQKKWLLNQEHIDKNNLIISLQPKTEELKEIVVTTKAALPSGTNMQNIVDTKYFDDAQSSPKNRLMYDGTIENGAAFSRMYKDLLKIFKKNREDTDRNKRTIAFKDYALANCNQDLFVKTFKLKPEEIASFLEFCDADPVSKKMAEEDNILALLDFMLSKSIVYKQNRPVTFN